MQTNYTKNRLYNTEPHNRLTAAQDIINYRFQNYSVKANLFVFIVMSILRIHFILKPAMNNN